IGSELNGQRNEDPDERKFTEGNRVINPRPLRTSGEGKIEWEMEEGTEIYDGAGVLIGLLAPTVKLTDRKVPVAKFNFGMSTVLNGRLCVYAFSVRIKPHPAVQKLIDAKDLEDGVVAVSAWTPIDRVVDKLTLLDRLGLG